MENTISETDISVSITYQSNRVVYAPGDAVIGSVVLKLKKPKKVEEIKVSAIGESAIKLKTPEGKQLRNNEKYFRYTFNVSTGGDSELTTGNHDFSFLITLPMVLPSSYEGEFGYVRYCIHADVKFEDVFAGDPNITSIFTVLDVVDLNTRCSSRMIQRIYCAKAASRILGRRENAVIVDLTTEKSGYVPGEFMYLNGRIVNGRSKPIKHVKIELWQEFTFHGRLLYSTPDSPLLKHRVSSAVATWSMDKGIDWINGESTANWERKKLFEIPPLLPSDFRNCKILNVQYFLKVTVTVPDSIWSSNIVGKSYYLTIGTVPLNDPREQQVQAGPILEQSAPPPYDPVAFANVPLPSYEEAITGGASFTVADNTYTD